MLLNFSTKFPARKPFYGKPTNFPQKIVLFKKKHTMRKDVHDRWRVGMVAHLCTGARTKAYAPLMQQIIKSIQKCCITWPKDDKNKCITDVLPVVRINGRVLGIMEVLLLALNDGFETADDFFGWFNEDGEYKILHWTDYTYDGDPARLEKANITPAYLAVAPTV